MKQLKKFYLSYWKWPIFERFIHFSQTKEVYQIFLGNKKVFSKEVPYDIDKEKEIREKALDHVNKLRDRAIKIYSHEH